MNLVLLCGHCGAIYRCLDTEGAVDILVGNRSEFWPDKYLCPNCGGQITGQHEEALPKGFHCDRAMDLRPQELLVAMLGMGLPEEHRTTIAEVSSLLLSSKIKSVRGSNIPNTTRCVLDYIELEDGTRIYTGASSHGATIYKITKPHNYTKKALDASSAD